DSRAAVQDPLQAIENLRLRHPGVRDRLSYRLHRGRHGDRRRLPAGAGAHLPHARADRRGGGHVDVPHPRDHVGRHRHARRHQPSGGRGARAHAHGGRRHRRAVRRARGPEDPRRAVAPLARHSRPAGRPAVRLRSHFAAGRTLFAASARERDVSMRRLLIPAAAFFFALSAPAARGEHLVVALSTHQVQINSSFVGTDLVLFGAIERDEKTVPRSGSYNIVARVSGPPLTQVTRRKNRVLGIWVNAESRVFIDAPGYLAMLSNRPLNEIAGPEVLRRYRIGLENVTFPQQIAGDIGDVPLSDPFRMAFLRLNRELRLYREVSNAVTFLTPNLFRTAIRIPANVPVGTYLVDVNLFAEGVLLATSNSAIEIQKVGFEQF